MCHQFTVTAVNFFPCVGAAAPNFPLSDNFPYQKLPESPADIDFIRRNKENSDPGIDLSEEDEDLRSALDMHQLISQRGPLSESPPQTADQVIEEIDQMLQSCDFSGSIMTDHTMESMDSMYSSMRSPLPNGQYEMDVKLRQAVAITSNYENLESFSYSRLLALSTEMEQLIQVYNDSLVEQLAHRDELEYEKEMKNTFISLLLSIQNRRRHFTNERKRKPLKIDPSQLPQYMTATIPYDENRLSMDMNMLMALIKCDYFKSLVSIRS
ncbi:unnamed protein product [Onchocerca flexuosa]|uniref:FEZ-like protein n=1 Tax=Onchocerca flexuosa TaxID=387005 RepID=A0A183H477_9BILA|nr:unnamed protein product [Onchocerca flexuosa]